MYVLEKELTILGFEVVDVKLGEAIIKDTVAFSQKLGAIEAMLKSNGFELMSWLIMVLICNWKVEYLQNLQLL